MSQRDKKVKRFVRRYQEKREAKKKRHAAMLPVKIIAGIALLGVVVYFVVQVFQAFNTPMTTVTALSTAVNDEFSVVGYFAREESILERDPKDTGILLYTVDEGEKVARYGEYAAVYSNTSAAQLKESMNELDERIAVLQNALNSDSDTSSITKLADDITVCMQSAAQLADDCDFSQMSDYITDLKSLIVARSLANTSVSDMENLISSLKSQRKRLESRIGKSETKLYSPESGYFSSSVDGYEDVFDTGNLDEMTVDDLNNITSKRASVTDSQVGRIITSYTWYYAAITNSQDALKLSQGSYVYLEFDAMGGTQVKVKVDSIGDVDGEETVVVFSSSEYSQELVDLRKQSANVILKTYSGLKVPKEAIRIDSDGDLGVYVITGLYLEFKNIDVLYETEDYYIVATDATDIDSLLINDLIIINGKGLANGKVIE